MRSESHRGPSSRPDRRSAPGSVLPQKRGLTVRRVRWRHRAPPGRDARDAVRELWTGGRYRRRSTRKIRSRGWSVPPDPAPAVWRLGRCHPTSGHATALRFCLARRIPARSKPSRANVRHSNSGRGRQVSPRTTPGIRRAERHPGSQSHRLVCRWPLQRPALGRRFGGSGRQPPFPGCCLRREACRSRGRWCRASPGSGLKSLHA
ncbi:hypothetical protein ACVMGC_006777 [Bradyrhizobium barranii subsp. barranii]